MPKDNVNVTEAFKLLTGEMATNIALLQPPLTAPIAGDTDARNLAGANRASSTDHSVHPEMPSNSMVAGPLLALTPAPLQSLVRLRFTSDRILDLSEYADEGRIERGRFETVWWFKPKITKDRIAVKSFPPPANEDFDFDAIQESFFREIEILISFDHPCLVPFRRFILPTSRDDSPKLATTFLEGGFLDSILPSTPPPVQLTAEVKHQIALDISSGMKFVHERGIIHRDLKTNNILLNSEHFAFIANFGSGSFEDLGITQTSAVGTLLYITPEQYSEDYEPKVDVYS
jgi:serine/threonine protein kinase